MTGRPVHVTIAPDGSRQERFLEPCVHGNVDACPICRQTVDVLVSSQDSSAIRSAFSDDVDVVSVPEVEVEPDHDSAWEIS